MSMDSDFADDGLLISENTDAEEVKDFLRRRMDNPYHFDGAVVYDFNSHEIDADALEEAVDEKLTNDRYLMPYQVTGTWGFMYHLLPESVKEAEILVYHPGDEKYYAYQNFHPEVPSEVQNEFRHQLSRLADQGCN
jgi:hypothetical protein